MKVSIFLCELIDKASTEVLIQYQIKLANRDTCDIFLN